LRDLLSVEAGIYSSKRSLKGLFFTHQILYYFKLQVLSMFQISFWQTGLHQLVRMQQSGGKLQRGMPVNVTEFESSCISSRLVILYNKQKRGPRICSIQIALILSGGLLQNLQYVSLTFHDSVPGPGVWPPTTLPRSEAFEVVRHLVAIFFSNQYVALNKFGLLLDCCLLLRSYL
jgi:hypothetical protein